MDLRFSQSKVRFFKTIHNFLFAVPVVLLARPNKGPWRRTNKYDFRKRGDFQYCIRYITLDSCRCVRCPTDTVNT